MEISFIAVKSEMVGMTDAMVEIVTRYNLVEIKRKRILMAENQFVALHQHVGHRPRIFLKMHGQMVGRSMMVVVFRGDDAVNQILEISGRKIFAHQNKAGTLRSRYGCREIGFYHLNAVHRPKNQDEVRDHLRILGISLP